MNFTRMTRRIAAATAMLLLLAALSGCSAKPLPEGFSADDVGTRAEEIVGYASAGDFESVVAQLRSDLSGAVTADQLAEGWRPTYERVGAFESVKRVAFSGTADASTGEEYAVAQLLCSHEKGDVLYTLSFDAELNLVGLYLK